MLVLRQYIIDTFPEFEKDSDFVEVLAKTVVEKKFEKGDVIVDFGDVIKSVPLVVDGVVKISRANEDNKEVFLYYLSEGNTCAASFSCCLIRKRSEIRAVCEKDATLLFIPLEKAEQWMGTYRVWRNYVLGIYDSRIFDLIDTIDNLAFAKLDEKLWDYLEEKSLVMDSKEIIVSHNEIAKDLNVSREAVSRLLKKLESNGQIKMSRGRLEILSGD